MTARQVLDGIRAQLAAATPGPWEDSRGATSDGSEFVHTYEQKAAFLALSLNEGDEHLWLVTNGEVIPAATGDGPKAKANAEFIAAAPTNVARLSNAVEAVLAECDYLDTLAPGDRHYAAGFRKLVENALKEGQ